MMKNYIPKNKDDLEAIEFLKHCSFAEIEHNDVSSLLEWMQDMHWEVAHKIAKYFIPYINDIKANLIIILDSNDNEWKYGVLFFLINKSEKKLDEDLMMVIKRIAEFPNTAEKSENLDQIANEILLRL
jgi:hypothetical protein